MKAYWEDNTKYYKYVYTDWTQPTLTSDGAFGSSEMAVALNFGSNNSQYGTAYKCFTPNTDLAGFYCDEYQSWMEVQMYFNNPLRIKTITFTTPDTRTSQSGAMTDTILYAGNSKGAHGLVYLNIGGKIYGTYTNNDVPDNGYYQYYTLYFKNEGRSYNDRVDVEKIKITGTARTSIESSASDYDYKVLAGKTFLVKENDIYKAIKTYEKGQYYGGNS